MKETKLVPVHSNAPVRFGAMAGCLAASMLAANAWLLLLVKCTVPVALALETALLAAFVWWAKGGGLPVAIRDFRVKAFRNTALTLDQWAWGLLAALFFAVVVHAAIVLLFRFVPYPQAAFRHGYDLSFLPSHAAQWLAVIFSAASAAICEEAAFRGFIQRPLELRYGMPLAVVVSAAAFTAAHLTKSWAVAGMIPIVFAAGILLGLIANAAGSLIPTMIGHFVMDVGLFAYWWTGIAGEFHGRPIREAGLDGAFIAACFALAGSLALVLIGISKLWQTGRRARAETLS